MSKGITSQWEAAYVFERDPVKKHQMYVLGQHMPMSGEQRIIRCKSETKATKATKGAEDV